MRFDELLRRLNAGSDDDGDSEGDGEDDIEGESEHHESRTWRRCRGAMANNLGIDSWLSEG